MKKVITILAIMMVLVGSVFAATNDKLYVTSTVEEVEPSFKMFGALSSSDLTDITYQTDGTGAAKVAGASKAATNTLAGGSIAAGNIDVYIKILQDVKSYYKDTTGFVVKVTASALTGTNGGSISAAVQGEPGVTGSEGDAFQSVKKSAANNIVEWTVKYATGAPVAAGTVLGTCQFRYAQNADAPVGDYSADIKIEYTTN